MTVQDGSFVEDTVDIILDAMVADFEEQAGEELPPSQSSVVRTLYRPVAERLAEAQGDIGLVLSSTQIQYASGTALDLLTALIGVRRRSATRGAGSVRFYRNSASGSDYSIPSGTKVTTDNGFESIEFRTTESAILTAGSTEVLVPVEASDPGPDGNVGSGTITRMPSSPVGIEFVTNPSPTDGGKDREDDEELSDRAESELAEGSSATAAALVSACSAIPDTRSVSIFINDGGPDSDTTLPDHSFELVVEGGTDQQIADAIMGTKAAGDTSWYGVNGTQASATVTIINGQKFDIYFSRPQEVTIYVDADLSVTSEYEGDNSVMDAVVKYIGGFRTSGNTINGELRVNDDVVYNSILSEIMEIGGVEDVTSLGVGTSASPTGTSNLTIDSNEVATVDATNNEITLTNTEV